MTDNWEYLLDAPVIEIKKTEDIVKARYNDEDIEDPSVEKKNNRVNEEDKNESPPKVYFFLKIRMNEIFI